MNPRNNRLSKFNNSFEVTLDDKCELDPQKYNKKTTVRLTEPGAYSQTGSSSTVDIFKQNDKYYIIKKLCYKIPIENTSNIFTIDNLPQLSNTNAELSKERFVMEYKFYGIMKELLKENITPFCIIGSKFQTCVLPSSDNKNKILCLTMTNETGNKGDLDTQNLDDFTNYNLDNLDHYMFATLLFQIVYTLQCFAKLGIQHNDLHLKNLLVYNDQKNKPELYKKDPTGNKFIFKNESNESRTANTEVILQNFGFQIRIFDFDRSIKKPTTTPIDSLNSTLEVKIPESAEKFEKLTGEFNTKQDLYRVISLIYVNIFKKIKGLVCKEYEQWNSEMFTSLFYKNKTQLMLYFRYAYLLYSLLNINGELEYRSYSEYFYKPANLIKLFNEILGKQYNYNQQANNAELLRSDIGKKTVNRHLALMYGYYFEYSGNGDNRSQTIKYIVAPYWEKIYDYNLWVEQWTNVNSNTYHFLSKTNFENFNQKFKGNSGIGTPVTFNKSISTNSSSSSNIFSRTSSIESPVTFKISTENSTRNSAIESPTTFISQKQQTNETENKTENKNNQTLKKYGRQTLIDFNNNIETFTPSDDIMKSVNQYLLFLTKKLNDFKEIDKLYKIQFTIHNTYDITKLYNQLQPQL